MTEPAARESRSLRVHLDERSYPIRIGYDTLRDAGEAIAEATGATRAAVISVERVARLYAPRLERSLRGAGVRCTRLLVPDGDRTKNLRQAARLYDDLLAFGADRGTAVIALGGGVVGDLAGYVAATFLRGVPFVQVPTTLLAMVDASVGGKVGVNLPQGKNLVGAFYQPRLVWMDVATLESLPPRQRRAGFAEMIKHAAIWEADLFTRFERDAHKVLELDPEITAELLERSCAIKAEVVSRDEREAGVRMLLNFGHTLGHAIEALGGYRGLLHGEAVSVGMAFAARRSEALGHANVGTAQRLGALLEYAGLPVEIPKKPRKAYLDALRVDKKRTERHIRFVVLREIGHATAVPLTPSEILPKRFPEPDWVEGARARSPRGRRS